MAVLVQWLLLPRGTLGGGRGMLVRLLGPFYLVVTWSLGHHPAASSPSEMRRGPRERSARLCLCTQGISYTTPTRFLTHVSSLLSPGGRCHLHLRDGSVTELSLCILQSPPFVPTRLQDLVMDACYLYCKSHRGLLQPLS